MSQLQNKPVDAKKRVLWSAVCILIAVFTVWTVTTQVKGFSPKAFIQYLRDSNTPWLVAAFCAMLVYILCDALMIYTLLKGFGHGRSLTNCVSYAASDIYFSAITPSATGGQPMEAYFMIRDGVPAIISSVVVLTYLLMYTLSIVVIGVVCLILCPSAFLCFSLGGRILIGVGALIQIALIVFYGMLLWNEGLLKRILHGGLKLLSKLHIVRSREEREKKLDATMDEYSQATALLRGHRKLLWKTLFWNLAHRASQISVTALCFLAGGGSPRLTLKLFSLQAYVVVGATPVPIPGSIGISDFLMLNGFSSLMSEQQAVNLELLSRTTSFYICVLLCGLIVLAKSALVRFGKKRV